MKRKRYFIWLILSFFSLMVFSCATQTGFSDSSSKNVVYHLETVDLTQKNLQIVSYVSDANNFEGIFINDFVSKTGAFVALNASPYSLSNNMAAKFPNVHSKYYNVGIFKTPEGVFSSPVQKYCALLFFAEDDGTFRAKVAYSQTDKIAEEADYAFGGFFQILSNYKIEDFSADLKNARTAVGVSEDEKTLFILSVEGKKGAGLSYPECAQILLEAGAKNAMQFDGGDSSNLFVNGKNAMSRSPSRKNASFIGFCLREN